MATTAWQQENTITEVDLARQAKLGTVAEMVIEQTSLGYQVVVKLTWHPEPVALRTRRSMTEPRVFKSLERLVAHISERYPAIRQVRIQLLEHAPAQPSSRGGPGKSPTKHRGSARPRA